MSGYAVLGSFFLGGLLFVGLGFLVSRWLQRPDPNPEKLSPYECGEESVGWGSTHFNFRFQLPAIIFLLFEVEIVLLAPVLLAQSNPPEGLAGAEWLLRVKWAAVLFVALLGLGFAAAWALGYLDWDKPEQKPMVYEGPVPDRAYEQANLTFEREQTERLARLQTQD